MPNKTSLKEMGHNNRYGHAVNYAKYVLHQEEEPTLLGD